jgi:hypothetical protein
MRKEQDAMMLVRAELSDRLTRLQSFSGRGFTEALGRDMAESLSALRTTAADFGMIPVVRLAEALERAMGEAGARRTFSCPIGLYLDRLTDAIDCGRTDEQVSEAMIASVSIRLAG